MEEKRFFKKVQKSQTAATVHQQQSTRKSTLESTLCVELSDEELCAVNGGVSFGGFGVGVGLGLGLGLDSNYNSGYGSNNGGLGVGVGVGLGR